MRFNQSRIWLALYCLLVTLLAGCTESKPVAFSSSSFAEESGNGTSYDGLQAQYFSYDLANPCTDLDATGAPMPNQIMFVDMSNNQINAAALARSQCQQLIPAAPIAASSLSLAGNNLVYLGNSFSPAPTGASSANGSSIPTNASLTDDSGSVWTVVGGIAYQNGVASPLTNSIIYMLFANGTIYQETSHLDSQGRNEWWYWANNAWVTMLNPPQF